MKLARLLSDGEPTFAISDDAETWFRLDAMGETPRTTAEALALIDARAGGNGYEAESEISGELICPIVGAGKMPAIGANYRAHLTEVGMPVPERPLMFSKLSSALAGPRSPIETAPDLTEKLDYEAELAVIIGRRARRVTPEEALDFVGGYAVVNDVSARDWQFADSQFDRSKNFDTFCPIGPWITTSDEISDPQNLMIRSFVNGDPRQSSLTSDMLFPVAEIISFLSRGMTMEPGDVLLTGSPVGTGHGMKPPKYLKNGDVVRCEIDGLGYIENEVVEESYQKAL